MLSSFAKVRTDDLPGFGFDDDLRFLCVSFFLPRVVFLLHILAILHALFFWGALSGFPTRPPIPPLQRDVPP